MQSHLPCYHKSELPFSKHRNEFFKYLKVYLMFNQNKVPSVYRYLVGKFSMVLINGV